MDFSIDLQNVLQGLVYDLTERQRATDLAGKMEGIWEHLADEIGLAQARMETAANRKRQPAPRYQLGDRVWLSTKNLQTERPSKKLDHKQIGPFRVRKVIGTSAYELELPASMKIHPVFHSSLLRLDLEDPLPSQAEEPPPPVVIADEEE